MEKTGIWVITAGEEAHTAIRDGTPIESYYGYGDEGDVGDRVITSWGVVVRSTKNDAELLAKELHEAWESDGRDVEYVVKRYNPDFYYGARQDDVDTFVSNHGDE
ncbi:MAG: hypothetical protein ABFD81_05740 [Syntrophaceae bacterium]